MIPALILLILFLLSRLRLGGTADFALPLHYFTGNNAQIAASYA